MTQPLTGKSVGAALGNLVIDLQLTDPPAFVAGVQSALTGTPGFEQSSPASTWEFEFGFAIGEKLCSRPGYHME